MHSMRVRGGAFVENQDFFAFWERLLQPQADAMKGIKVEEEEEDLQKQIERRRTQLQQYIWH